MSAENPNNDDQEEDKVFDWGEGLPSSSQREEIVQHKTVVNEYDIFILAKWILIIAAFVYVLFGLIRIFYPGHEISVNGQKVISNEGITEVWEYTKVFLNSIISLILGLYFGAKAEAAKKR